MKNNPTYIKTFEEFSKAFEGDGTFKMKTKANGDGREPLDKVSDETTGVVIETKEQISTCVEIIENVLNNIGKVKITKKPLESCLGELKTYLAGLDSAIDTLSKSNTLNI
jgi:hypothetical protein